ncbi:MAG: glycosyltransferase family 4 protein [Alphaproteobacteria bacterium]|nr:glycosyltransferase family 4 protein [Alphaproteobacteria bacterium]
MPFKWIVSIKKDNYANQITKYKLDEDCEFLGWVSDKEEFFKKTDLHCLPSRGEGLPLTVLEAMMYEKPVTVSDCSDSVEIVKNSDAGLIHSIGDSKQLAEQLEFLLVNSQERLRMGKKARQHILCHFNNKDLMNRLSKIIEDVCAK